MTSTEPAAPLGASVIYRLNDADANVIMQQRAEAGFKIRCGNGVRAGQEYPATVVAAWGGPSVNLQVALDGNDTYWATSRVRGTDEGQWRMPGDPPAAEDSGEAATPAL